MRGGQTTETAGVPHLWAVMFGLVFAIGVVDVAISRDLLGIIGLLMVGLILWAVVQLMRL